MGGGNVISGNHGDGIDFDDSGTVGNVVVGNLIGTNIDGTAINSSSDLTPAIQGHKPGEKIKVTWTAPDGSTHTATATLTTGPVA